jgi:hypothetical protein
MRWVEFIPHIGNSPSSSVDFKNSHGLLELRSPMSSEEYSFSNGSQSRNPNISFARPLKNPKKIKTN